MCVCDFFIYLLDCVVLLYLYSVMGKCVDVGACLCFFFFLSFFFFFFFWYREIGEGMFLR